MGSWILTLADVLERMLPWIISLAAVVVSPLVALIVSRRAAATQIGIAKAQIRAQLVSANRQAWINALRKEVADFLGLLGMVGYGLGEPEITRKAISTRSSLGIRLNLSEPEHAELDENLNSLLSLMVSSGEDPDKRNPQETGRLVSEITSGARKVIKIEWDHIKAGE